MHVKANNTTGLPDVYNHIKSSLLQVDINTLGDDNEDLPLWTALIDGGSNADYLLENKASTHLYYDVITVELKVFNTYNDVLLAMNQTGKDEKDGAEEQDLVHFIDRLLSVGLAYSYELNIYNLMKYKAYPSTCVPSEIGETSCPSHFTSAKMRLDIDFVKLLLNYLLPANARLQVDEYEDLGPTPLMLVLSFKIQKKDIIYESIQYGCTYNLIDEFDLAHELDCDDVLNIVRDQDLTESETCIQ